MSETTKEPPGAFAETPIAPAERVLTEVDHLLAARQSDGTYPTAVLDAVHLNLRTAVQEAAMPYAVSTVEHDYVATPEQPDRRGTFMWLGKTAVEAAMTGYKYHVHTAARDRVAVEVDEARHAESDLRPGVMKIFISPRMSQKDAPRSVAEAEHLGHDDAVRASWLITDKEGNVQKRVLKSLLVREIPLGAWVAMLQDPANLFHKSIAVDDPDSALSVMRLHRELELPLDALPEGPVGVVEAVLPYIADPEVRQKVAEQLVLFRGDQHDMQRKAENISDRWLAFEAALADSLAIGEATFEIKGFIVGLQQHWGKEDLEVILSHQQPNCQYRMSRELAAVLESAKQNVLWTSAAVVTDNEEVLRQMTPQAAAEIRQNEMLIQIAQHNGYDIRAIEAENNRLAATQNVRVGGGCPGSNTTKFRTEGDGTDPSASAEAAEEQSETWIWKQGVCQVQSCSTRPGKTEVGPCSVCRKCQARFDRGEDPTKDKVVEPKPVKNQKPVPVPA